MKIELFHVADCHNVDAARRLLQQCTKELGISEQIIEREGDYPSPSIVVDGVDVTGRPDLVGAMCRLDLPTRDRVLRALRHGRPSAS